MCMEVDKLSSVQGLSNIVPVPLDWQVFRLSSPLTLKLASYD